MATTVATTSKRPQPFGRYHRFFELALLTFNLALFIYCLADWLGWTPSPHGFQPLRMVYLSGALLVQLLAALVRPRSMPASLVLVAASMGLLVLSVSAGR